MNKQMVDKFFELIDSNGQYNDWRFIQISNVRAYNESQKVCRENVKGGEKNG